MSEEPRRTMKKAQDQRVKRTYAELINAAEELFCESSPEEMSVKQICERAGIQRTTFYQHFRDVHDFLDWYIVQKQNEFRSFSSISDKPYDQQAAFLEIAVSTMRYVKQNEKLVKRLMNRQINGKLLFDLYVNTCVNEIITKLNDLSEAGKGSRQTPISFLAEFYAGGLISVFRWWIVNDKPIPEEDFMRYLRIRVENRIEK